MNIEISQIITQIISFLIMYWVLKRFAWKPLLASMEKRKALIQSEFDLIESQKKDLADLSHKYQDQLNDIDDIAASKTKEAVEQGKEIAARLKEEATAQSRALIAKAHTDIEKELYKAKSELKNEIIDLASAMAEKLLKGNMNKDRQKEILDRAIQETDIS